MNASPSAPLDTALMSRRRSRWSRGGAEPPAFLADAVATELAERLSIVQRRFGETIDLGEDGGALAGRLAALDTTGKLSRLAIPEDEALALAPGSVDLIVSNLALHLTNDTPGVMAQIARALRPDGLFLASLLGGETLTELRRSLLAAEAELTGGASPRVLPFIELRDAGALLQRTGFALPVIDQDRLSVRYDTMFDLIADLRGMGAANNLSARSRRPASRRLFLRAAEIYAERFADPDGRVRATFDVVYLSGWKPHESQQKPLKPGSAKVSLADALKAR